MAQLFGVFLFLGLLGWIADQIDMKAIRREIRMMRMSRDERSAFRQAEADAEMEAQRVKDLKEREWQYLRAVAKPQKFCLMAMREGRNYTRQWVDLKDLHDIDAWAEANGIAVTEMERDRERVKLSFGELRRAKKTARFMGESL